MRGGEGEAEAEAEAVAPQEVVCFRGKQGRGIGIMYCNFSFGYAIKVHTYFDDGPFQTYDALIFDWDRMDGQSTKTLKDRTYIGIVDAVISFPGGYGPILRVVRNVNHKTCRNSAEYWEWRG